MGATCFPSPVVFEYLEVTQIFGGLKVLAGSVYYLLQLLRDGI